MKQRNSQRAPMPQRSPGAAARPVQLGECWHIGIGRAGSRICYGLTARQCHKGAFAELSDETGAIRPPLGLSIWARCRSGLVMDGSLDDDLTVMGEGKAFEASYLPRTI
jgi:hypothetical protein